MTKSKKTKKEKTGPLMLFLRVAALGFALVLVFSLVSGRIQLARMQRELDTVNDRIALQMEENEELRRLMETGDQAAYVERIARERLGYARPGERIFIDITGE